MEQRPRQPKVTPPPVEESPPVRRFPGQGVRMPQLSPGEWSREINGGRFFVTNRNRKIRAESLRDNIVAEIEITEYPGQNGLDRARGDGCQMANADVMAQSKAMLEFLVGLYNDSKTLTTAERDELRQILRAAGVKGFLEPSRVVGGVSTQY